VTALRRLAGRLRRRWRPAQPFPHAELAQVKEVWPPAAVVFDEPHVFRPDGEVLDALSRHRRFAGRAMVLPPVMVFAVPDGMVHPRTGMIQTADGRVIVESARDHVLLERNLRRNPRWPSPSAVRPGTGSTIWRSGGANYYHWLVDCLPRLYALERAGLQAELVFPDAVPAFARRLLELVLPAGTTARFETDDRAVQYERVLLTPFTTLGGAGLLRPEIAAWLRDRLGVDEPPFGDRRRVYVSRARSRARHQVANEDEVIRALATLDVEPVVCEEMTVDEQRALFKDCELIVGPHGAGLANMLFARSAAVVDIHANGEVGGADVPAFQVNVPAYYGPLAASLGHRYVAVYHDSRYAAASFSVDVGRVVAAAERALDLAGTDRAAPSS
jgi:hypothetical protein